LTEPLVRENGMLRPASWDEALDRPAAGFAVARERDATKSFGASGGAGGPESHPAKVMQARTDVRFA